jgi:hypothetical protein
MSSRAGEERGRPEEAILTIADLESRAKSSGKLSKMALDYYQSGADGMVTLGENKAAFQR